RLEGGSWLRFARARSLHPSGAYRLHRAWRAALERGSEIDGVDLQAVHVAAEEAGGDLGEAAREIGDHQGERAGAALAGELALGQQLGELGGGRFGAVDDRDRTAGDARRLVAQDGREQGVVRAAEDERVDALGDQRLEVAARDEGGHLAVEPALLDERNEQRGRALADLGAGADARDGPRIGAGGDGARGRDDADLAAPAGAHAGPGARLDDAEDRHVELDPEHRQGDRADRVARHDEELDVVLGQVARAGPRVAQDGARA